MSNFKLFETAKIRSVWDEDANRWYFAIVDVVQVLTDSVNPTDYLKKLRKRDYQSKGYSPEWIEKRVRCIAIRDELNGEWQKRGVKEQREYAILTSEISKATFGMTPSEYRDLKELGKTGDNLRDHMSDLELIFTMLGEASTTEITRKHDAQGFGPNHSAARAGGKVAGNARRDLERKSGRKVATNQNYKQLPEAEVRKRIPKNQVKTGDTP